MLWKHPFPLPAGSSALPARTWARVCVHGCTPVCRCASEIACACKHGCVCEQCVHVCAMCVYTAAVQALQVCAWVMCVRVHSGAAASQRVHELARGSQRQQPLPAELCLHLCLYLSVHACTRAWGRIPCSTVHARCVCVQRVPAVHTPWAAVPADVSACSCLHACPRGCGPRGAVHTFNAHV